MDGIKEKVAYLKGLSDGLPMDRSSNEGKLLLAIVDVLDAMAEEIDIIGENETDLEEYVNSIDEDLADIEEDYYDDDDDDEDDDNGNYLELECPNCHETVYIDKCMLDEDEEIVCPNCGKPIEFENSCCEHEDCDCDH